MGGARAPMRFAHWEMKCGSPLARISFVLKRTAAKNAATPPAAPTEADSPLEELNPQSGKTALEWGQTRVRRLDTGNGRAANKPAFD